MREFFRKIRESKIWHWLMDTVPDDDVPEITDPSKVNSITNPTNVASPLDPFRH